MKYFFYITFLLFSSKGFSQKGVKSLDTKNVESPKIEEKKATIDLYRIISHEQDTTYVDTSLNINSEYKYNYLRKDIFGLLPFANEGQTYAVLNFGQKKYNPFPEIGFSGKHFNFLKPNNIPYYSVATPTTELYFKTVMEQGQNLDALITLNTHERLNFSFAFKGLRSLGKYINQLSSTGNFRFTASYNTKNNRYFFNTIFTGQDILNGENGGILSTDDFEGEDTNFDNRARLKVYLTDAKTFLKGKRYFINHTFRINKKENNNSVFVTHQFDFENKFFEYNQKTVATEVSASESFNRFGESFLPSNINDHTLYNKMYNRVGIIYKNKFLGEVELFGEDFRYNYYYDKVIILNSGAIPSFLKDRINTIGGQYQYRKNKWNGKFSYSNSITDQSLSNFDANVKYKFNEKNEFVFQYQLMNKIPDHIFNLYQSSYIDYNWSNNFNNEKINNFEALAKTQWIEASLQISSIKDHLYFSNDAMDARQQIISPKQYGKSINYLSIKVSREFKWWKLALDNTVLYQQVEQQDAIINVPKVVSRNSLYFSNHFFKKALYLQTGFIFNYFTKHYINDYNPVTAEAFVQTQKKVGDFPMVDFFVNARIRQTRIFLKAEHFNSSFTGNKFYTAPNYPYRDFMIRFGLVWNFFQ